MSKLRKLTEEELKKILELHEKFLRGEIGGVKADLGGANLRGANLRGVNLRGANLEEADLRLANLSDANLIKADLRYADLRYADLTSAELSDANLEGANLSEANLKGTNLSEANLKGANLDFSCLPLWCGSLKAHMDDRQVTQLLYHVLSIVKYSDNVSDDLKSKLLTDQNLDIANEFHRVRECGEL